MRWLFSFCFSFTDFQLETVIKAFHITFCSYTQLKNCVGSSVGFFNCRVGAVIGWHGFIKRI